MHMVMVTMARQVSGSRVLLVLRHRRRHRTHTHLRQHRLGQSTTEDCRDDDQEQRGRDVDAAVLVWHVLTQCKGNRTSQSGKPDHDLHLPGNLLPSPTIREPGQRENVAEARKETKDKRQDEE